MTSFHPAPSVSSVTFPNGTNVGERRRRKKKKITTLPFTRVVFFVVLDFCQSCDISDITWRQQHATPPEPLWRRAARQPRSAQLYCTQPPSVITLRLRADRNRRLRGLWGTEEEEGGGFSPTDKPRSAETEREREMIAAVKYIHPQNRQDLCEVKFWAAAGDHPAGLVSSSEWHYERRARALVSKNWLLKLCAQLGASLRGRRGKSV